MQEEIDQEALQCLSAQDLQAIGVRDPSHRRKLLSAALQLQSACTTHIASHTLEKPTDPTASQHTKQTTSAQTAAPLLKKEYGTAAQRTQHACADWQPRTTSLSGCSSAVRLDKQAVLRLQQQDKAKMQVVASMAVNGDSSISNNNATKLNAPRNIAPGQSASAAAEPATSLANKSHKVKYSQTAGRSATASSTAGASIASISQAHGQLHPSSSSLLSCPCVAPVAGKITQNSKRAQRPTSTESAAAATVQAHQSSKNGLSVASAATAAGMVNSTGPNSKHAHMRKLSAAAAKGGVVEPKSKADEEHQLALALSASMGEPLAGPRLLHCAVTVALKTGMSVGGLRALCHYVTVWP